MMVPDEWAIEFHELDLLTVKFPSDSRLEVVREKGELFLKVDLFHADRLSRFDLVSITGRTRQEAVPDEKVPNG